MKCSEFEKLEMKYIDGTLSPKEREAMEKHRGECEKCRKELELYDRLTEDLKVLPVPDIDENFTCNVMQRVALVQKPGKGLLFAVICSVISAASSVAGFFNLVILNREELTEAVSQYVALKPVVGLIDFLAGINTAICNGADAFKSFLSINGDGLMFGTLAIGLIALGIYSALKKSLAGGIGR